MHMVASTFTAGTDPSADAFIVIVHFVSMLEEEIHFNVLEVARGVVRVLRY